MIIPCILGKLRANFGPVHLFPMKIIQMLTRMAASRQRRSCSLAASRPTACAMMPIASVAFARHGSLSSYMHAGPEHEMSCSQALHAWSTLILVSIACSVIEMAGRCEFIAATKSSCMHYNLCLVPCIVLDNDWREGCPLRILHGDDSSLIDRNDGNGISRCIAGCSKHLGDSQVPIEVRQYLSCIGRKLCADR